MAEFTAHLNIKPTEEMKRAHGLGYGGAIQRYIDSECIRRMSPYTPMLSGVLDKSATLGTVIGSGEIHQDTPYSRFQYYGKVMTTEDGRVWARKNEAKPIVTNRDLVHNKSRHQNAGPRWFERMATAEREDILNGVQEVAKRL